MARDRGVVDPSALNVRLTPEECGLLEGAGGPIQERVMRAVVLYAEALSAERLVDITGNGHFVITCALPGLAPSLEMLDEFVSAGLRTCRPFTLDPLPPLDYESWFLGPQQVRRLERMYAGQAVHMARMSDLGLLGPDACTCTPYLPEVGNVPRRGDILAWSESACVAYANSVLGARTNRNGAIIDLLCNLVGKAPLSGLLTDEGRRATRLVEVATADLPSPQLLGAAIGRYVGAEVPYITGLGSRLGAAADPSTRDFLHEMGAAAATAGAVGLFHVEGVTPEALDQGPALVEAETGTYRIDEDVLLTLEAGLPGAGDDPATPPAKCFLGCPHLSLEQLRWWADAIGTALAGRGGGRVLVPTTLAAAPAVLRVFRQDQARARLLDEAGVRLSAACPMQLFDDGLSAGEAIVTNSLKLGSYTHARFVREEEVLRLLVGETVPGTSP